MDTSLPAGQNRLLLSLPIDEQARLRSRFETVDLEFRKNLAGPDRPAQHVYFVDRGLISLVKPMQDGAAVEVGLIGREGFVGVAVVLGDVTSTVEQMVQVAGSGRRMGVAEFRAQMAQCPVLSARLLLYAQAVLAQISQTAACNGRHTVQERLARWLLMASDRIESDRLPLSHELLSMMLGVRRPGITVALGTLRRAGLINGTHGKIEICDRPALESVACECYGVVRDEYRRLLPY
jgi:CRP-like cAMP-binding protein